MRILIDKALKDFYLFQESLIVCKHGNIVLKERTKKKSDTFVHVTKWSMQEKYDNKSIPRLWKLREESKSKQQHTQIKRGKVDDSQLYMISTWKQWLYIGYIVSQ